MMQSQPTSRAFDQGQEQLANLLEEMTRKLEAGQPVDLEQYERQFPELAGQLRDLVSGIEVLASLGFSAGRRMAELDPLDDRRQLGDFRILQEIGRGGMGVVYEAEQLSLDRHVAVKVLPLAAMLDEKQLQRFKSEARAAATLSHPHIVPIYFVGVERGVHYYAMQLIQGVSLQQILAHLRGETGDERKPSSSPDPRVSLNADTRRTLQALVSTEREHDLRQYCRTLAELGVQAAEALHYAHSRGIVHRDVKPANLLLDPDRHLWVTDFGLARLEQEPSATITGDLVGTLRYMSPEQARGAHTMVDQRTDIYSLGATLYELLTLQPLVGGRDRDDLLRKIMHEQPRAPRKINPQLPVDLETILLKSVEKNPAERYSTAQDLADDLQRFLDDKSIQARRPSVFHRLARWSRRHRTGVMTAAIMLVIALTVSTIVCAWAYRSAVAEREEADRQRQQAQENLQVALRAVDSMYQGVATQWMASDTALTSTQQYFLTEALAVYQHIAQQLQGDPQQRPVVASAYWRIAGIYCYLDDLTQAGKALDSAIALYQDLVNTQPDQREYRSNLADCYTNRSIILSDLGEQPQARQALDQAQEHLRRLADRFPDEIQYQEDLATNDLRRGETMLAECRAAEAERLARQSRDRLAELSQADAARLETSLKLVQSGLLLTRSLQSQDKFGESQLVGGEVLQRVDDLRVNYTDRLDLARWKAELTQQRAELFLALGQPQQAAEQFRASMQLQRQTFKARVKPAMWSLGFFLKDQYRDAEYEEPEPFCGYIETQTRLSAALQQLGQAHGAELELGEAVYVSEYLARAHGEHARYYVAWANACADVYELLRERRPGEAAQYLDRAAAIWHKAVEDCPAARSFRSGVRGNELDLQWFQRTYPDQPVDERAGGVNQPNLSDSVFRNHTTGVLAFEAELWEEAIRRLSRAAQLRTEEEAFDWVYLAMAYRQLGDEPNARQWYEKVDQWIQEHPAASSELCDLRAADE